MLVWLETLTEHALGLPVGSRGSQVLLAPNEEVVEAAETGAVTFFDWPLWLGPHPPTFAAQSKALQDWAAARIASSSNEWSRMT
eukprot:2218332-Amphidinium_carterae.3